MPNPTDGRAMNAPVWNPTTTVQSVTLTGGFDAVTIGGYFVIISNTGASNASVGPDAVTEGVLLQPGETFETAVVPASPLFVKGTAAATVSVVEYKNA